MIKYASNTFLATKISFINAIANICDAVGADVKEVAMGMGYDARIGFEFLKPGPGFGGSCFPKDCKALIAAADNGGYDFGLLRGVLHVNDEQQNVVVRKLERALGSLEGKTIAAWGLAFKPNTDDVRESPAIAIIEKILAKGATVRGYDPVVDEDVYERFGIKHATSSLEAAEAAHAIVILTEWNEFKWLDFEALLKSMSSPVVVDARNMLDPHVMRQIGFNYSAIGR
jgi:UDPglucose 6-dehydrogenase